MSHSSVSIESVLSWLRLVKSTFEIRSRLNDKRTSKPFRRGTWFVLEGDSKESSGTSSSYSRSYCVLSLQDC